MQVKILDILSFLGALGIFIFGMKVMSEALQKSAGPGMRRILARITANKARSIFTGFIITGLIQSSSATTVMVVSFVNAGLLSLVESIGVIMGANIGTTVTGWIISLLGFKVKLGALTLPLIGLSFPFLFLSGKKRHWAEFAIGFAIIFIGLQFLKNTLPDVSTNPEILQFFEKYAENERLNLFIFFLSGIVITSIIQSSSISMALTLVIGFKGWINFEQAAAMVIGENIGTTVTALFASLIANRQAKRAALSHLLFNLVGSIWMIPAFGIFTTGIVTLTEFITQSPIQSAHANFPLAVSLFHSAFNITNMLLLVFFIPYVARFTFFLLPGKQGEGDSFNLKYIKGSLLDTAELSLLQAKKEIDIFAKRSKKMFSMVTSLFFEVNEEAYTDQAKKIERFYFVSNRIKSELEIYLNKLSQFDLGNSSTKETQILLRTVDSIARINGSLNNFYKTIKRKKKEKIWFTQEIRDNMKIMFQHLDKAFSIMALNLNTDYNKLEIAEAEKVEKEINKMRNRLKKDQIKNIDNKNYKYQASLLYNDLYVYCERVGDHIFTVSTVLHEMKTV